MDKSPKNRDRRDRPVKLALYHTVQGLSQQVVSRERESSFLLNSLVPRLRGDDAWIPAGVYPELSGQV